ncbi:MAG TPA: 2OG-Fe(II) oxygenase [Pirellulales bacterium]|nr:2OG-Fe(II) oxygenase [Pirellulales bacterium]
MNDQFLLAQPFPHLVLDDFMPADSLRAAAAEFDAVPDEAWVRYDSCDEHGKRACNRRAAMGPACRRILACLTHPTSARLAGLLTGLDGLVSDPTLYGGGLHVTEPGGWLGIHADNERHPVAGLARRLNLIVYCTEWASGGRQPPVSGAPVSGGALELWDRAAAACVRSIEPRFNRAVLFETGPHDHHGHPEPLRSPAGISRKSIAVYYWSEPRRRARFVRRADEAFDARREEARVRRAQ